MNKITYMVIPCLLATFALPAMAEDAAQVGVVQRTDCAAVQAELDKLNAVDTPTDVQSARMEELNTINRRDCAKRATGRRTNNMRAGALPVASSASAPAQPVSVAQSDVSVTDPIDAFVSARDENCKNLKAAIDKGAADKDKLAQMQKLHDGHCAAIDLKSVSVVEKTAEEVAALIESGLCADGTKPNKFGCCTGETFKDLGNLQFACCPNDGGECYPPMK